MRLGLISDTHDNVAAIERAVDVFADEGVETIIHCGDFIAPPVLPFFEGFTLHGVLGNNDGELDGLEAGFRALGNGSRLHGRLAELTVDGVDIAVLHGESRARVDELAASGRYDLVCFGHHHEREATSVDDCLVVNPGAHFPTVPAAHNTVALYETETGDVEFVDVRADER